MGIACSCLKDGTQTQNPHHNSPVTERRMVRARKLQKSEQKDASVIEKEKCNLKENKPKEKNEQDSSRGICGEMGRIDDNRSIPPYESPKDSVDDIRAEEENEVKVKRGFLEAFGYLNGMRKPIDALTDYCSPVSSPVSDGTSPPSPHSISVSLSPSSPSPRRSADAIREFAERISKRILSIGREPEDGMEIAWFSDRRT